MNWQIHKKKLLKNPQFKQALIESELEYQVAKALVSVRLKSGLTQAELAVKLNTTQSAVSRAESAKSLPSLTFLKRMAAATDTTL